MISTILPTFFLLCFFAKGVACADETDTGHYLSIKGELVLESVESFPKTISDNDAAFTREKINNKNCGKNKNAGAAFCKPCGISFKYDKLYKAHCVEKHENKRPYVCEVCNRGFMAKHNLHNHAARAHAILMESKMKRKALVICPLCLIPLNGVMELNAHARRVHPGEKVFRCQKCREQFYERSSLWKHENKTHPSTRMRCEHCRKAFQTFEMLQRHGVACEKNRLKYIMRNYTKDNVNRLSKVQDAHLYPSYCDICGIRFPFYSHYMKHRTKAHPGMKIFLCEYCGRKYTTKQTLFNHMDRRHTLEMEHNSKIPARNPTERLYECLHCGQEFIGAKRYHQHGRERHPEQRLYACEHCERGFNSKRNLNRHLRGQHDSGRKDIRIAVKEELECSWSDYDPRNFESKDAVNFDTDIFFRRMDRRHTLEMKEHDGKLHTQNLSEHLYECLHCGQEFVGVKRYHQHGRERHPGQQLYACKNCKRGFNSRWNLNRHLHGQHAAATRKSVPTVVKEELKCGSDVDFTRFESKDAGNFDASDSIKREFAELKEEPEDSWEEFK